VNTIAREHPVDPGQIGALLLQSALVSAIHVNVETKGCATWAPVRNAREDWARWGAWECWADCTVRPLKLDDGSEGPMIVVPTGHWIAWDSANPESKIGYPNREQAEQLAVLRNEGARTRVVPFSGQPFASRIDFDELHALVAPRVAKLAETLSPEARALLGQAT
jgi:hypothetical protein